MQSHRSCALIDRAYRGIQQIGLSQNGGPPSQVSATTNLDCCLIRCSAEMAKIPKFLHEHINTAFPANVCLVATVLTNGFAQVTPRGSTMVFNEDHLALWERGKGT